MAYICFNIIPTLILTYN